MALPTARRRHAKVAIAAALAAKAKKRARERRIAERDKEVAAFCQHAAGLSNENGRSRTFEENRVVLLAMMITMQLWMELIRGVSWDPLDWTWSQFDSMISSSLHMLQEHCRRLRLHFVEKNEVLVFGQERGELSRCGGAAVQHNNHNRLSPSHLQWIVEYVDNEHAAGRTVNNGRIRAAIFSEFGIELSKTTMSTYFKNVGLTWKKTKSRRRDFAAYCTDAIRTYLVELHKLRQQKAENNNIVFVYTDESYVHQTHCQDNSFVGQNAHVNKKKWQGSSACNVARNNRRRSALSI